MAKRGLRSIGINKIIPAQIDFTQVVSGTASSDSSFIALSPSGTPVLVAGKVDFSSLSTITPTKDDSFYTLDSDGSTTQKTTVSGLATFLADGSTITATNGVLSAAGGASGDITGVDLTAGTGIDIGSETNTTSGDYSATISVDVSDFMSNGSNNRIVTAAGADSMNAEANLTFDGSTLYANGKVGIGQSTPPKTLTVEFTDDDTTVASGRTLAAGGTGDGVLIENISTAANAYANLDFKVGAGDARIAAVHDGSSNTSIHFATEVNANTFSSDLVISSGGKVGIGTTSPSNTLQVNVGGGDGDNGILIVRDDASTLDTNILGGLGFDSSGGNVPSSILEASAYVAALAAEDHGAGDKGGDLVFGTAPIDQNDDTTSSERVRITSEGRVGVGVISPKHLFHVAGQGYFTRTGIGDSHVRKTLTVAFTGSDTTVATGENLVQSAYGDGNGNGVLIHNAGSSANSYANLDFKVGTAESRIALVFKNANDGDFHFVTKNDGSPKSSMVIQSDGKVGIGSTAPVGPLHTVDESSDGYLRIDNNVDNQLGNGIYFRKSRGSAASKTVVQENDQLGALWFLGYNDDGTAYTAAAAIVATVDGEPSTSTDSTDMPGRLEFRTAPDGSSTAQNRMVIKENGRIAIGGETSWDPSHTVHINDDSITLLALESPGADGANGPQQAFYKSRGSVGSETVVQDGDILGEMVYYGHDGTNYEKSAQILVKVDGEPATSSDPTDMPSRIEFATSLDGNVNNTTRMTIKNNGAVGIGTTTPSGQLHVADVGGLSISTTGRLGVGCEPSYYDLQVVDDGGYALVAFDSYTDQAFGSHLYFRHARGTESSPTVVQDGDRIGGIVFQGYNNDGTAHDNAAAIYAIVDGDPSTSTDDSDMPGRLEFRCSPDSESTAGVKMVIKSDGKVGIGTETPRHTLDVPAIGGLILSYVALTLSTPQEDALDGTFRVIESSDQTAVITFIAPQSGNIELQFSCLLVTSDYAWIYLSYDTDTSYTSTAGREILVLQTDESDDSVIDGRWTITGLTPGTSYTYYIYAKENGSATNTATFRWGGTSTGQTNGAGSAQPLIIRAVSLPSTIVQDN